MNRSFAARARRLVFHRLLGGLFYQNERVFHTQPWPTRRLRRALNQYWNERGIRTPFMFSAPECVEFWQSIDNTSLSSNNRPVAYAGKDTSIVDFLHQFWRPFVGTSASLLELGCNCGANLERFRGLGYSRLAGVEVNPNAIAEMERAFPVLARLLHLERGSFEAVLPKMETASFDLVLTMGVSMHIHPGSNFIFKEMARISSRWICTVEPEAANSNYVFARNYRRVFERLGYTEKKSELLFGPAYAALRGYDTGCIVRLMERR